MKAFVPLLFACVVLSSCSHLETWWGKNESSQEVVVEQPAVTPWWQVFNDPLMDRFAGELLTQNLDIRLAQTRITEARGMLRVAESGWFPNIGVTGSATRGNSFIGAPKAATIADGGFEATWEPDVFGHIRAQVSGAEAEVMVQEASLADAKNVMLAELMRAVIDWRAAQENIREITALLATQDEQVSLFASRVDAGLVDATFLTRAQAERSQTATRLPLAHAAAESARLRIATLLARPAQAVDMTEDAAVTLAVPLTVPPVAEVMEVDISALRNRPDLRRLRAQMAAADAQLAQAEAELWPRISLQAVFGVREGSDGLPIAGNPMWSLASSLTAPLFNFGKLRGAVDVANARTEAAQLAYEKGVLSALEETHTALSDYVQGINAVAEQEAALTHRKDTVALAAERFENGLTDMTNLTTAQAELNQATLELTERKAQAATAYIRLQKALGLVAL